MFFSIRKSWHPIIALLLTITAVIVWAVFIRIDMETPFVVEWDKIVWLEPYVMGYAILEVMVGVGSVYIFSRTPLFRRLVTDQTAERDNLKLTAVLIGIQIVAFVYRFGLSRAVDESVTQGLFVVIVAGLLGGWRAGTIVGAFTMLAIGWFDYALWLEPDETFELLSYLEYYVVTHIDAVTAVWAGSVIGLIVTRWPTWRYRPRFVVGITAVVVTAVFWIGTYASESSDSIERWLPNAVVLGLATAVFALLIRSVQDEESRHHAESAQLELTQTRLTLAQTELALTQAELRALHAQINPHFFFNTLNTIRYFIRTDPDTARDLLIKLSEIFQRALSAGEFVSLRDEISYVEAYLALEKARLDERLRIIWTNMAKSEIDQRVPTLILQPIVENAVIHGISTQPDGGSLHIVINRLEDDLLIQVGDDGAGFDVEAVMAQKTADDAPARSSIGLRNVDDRLRLLYGDSYRLHIESTPDEGTRVIFRIPLGEIETGDRDER